jgi:hypothetical protein
MEELARVDVSAAAHPHRTAVERCHNALESMRFGSAPRRSRGSEFTNPLFQGFRIHGRRRRVLEFTALRCWPVSAGRRPALRDETIDRPLPDEESGQRTSMFPPNTAPGQPGTQACLDGSMDESPTMTRSRSRKVEGARHAFAKPRMCNAPPTLRRLLAPLNREHARTGGIG